MGATEVSEKLDRQKKGPSWIMKCADLPKERWRRTSQDSELWVEWRHGGVGEGSSWLQTEPLGGRGGSAFGWSGVSLPPFLRHWVEPTEALPPLPNKTLFLRWGLQSL